MKINKQKKKTIIFIHMIGQVLWQTRVIQIKDSLIKGQKEFEAKQSKKWSKRIFYYLIK